MVTHVDRRTFALLHSGGFCKINVGRTGNDLNPVSTPNCWPFWERDCQGALALVDHFGTKSRKDAAPETKEHQNFPYRGQVSDSRYTIVTIRGLLAAEILGSKRGPLTLTKISSFRAALSLLAIFVATFSAKAQFTKVNAAGSTFAALIMEHWSEEFSKANPNVQIIYLAVGSGLGITNFTEGIVDFAASDAAMTDEQIVKVKQGVVLIPFTAASIVLAYNLPGVESLKLSREAYTGIFLGKITKWNDPAIAKTNEGVNLPDTAITVCERSDSSGTTFVFAKHLSSVPSSNSVEKAVWKRKFRCIIL